MESNDGVAGPRARAGLGAQRAEIVQRLGTCLDAVMTAYGLTKRDVRAAERGIRRLDRRSMAPPANEFWETTAYPRALRLQDEARHVIDRELSQLASLDDHLSRSEAGRSETERALVAALPTPCAINDLGSWWQRRLRRAAILRAMPAIVTGVPGQAELAVAEAEVLLLAGAPWSHGDRLLAAFELAHAEIGRYGRRRISELLAGRWAGAERERRSLAAARR